MTTDSAIDQTQATDAVSPAAGSAATDGPEAEAAPPFRYTAALAARDRGPLAGPLGGRGHLQRAQPDRPAGARRTVRPVPADKLYLLDMFPYPSGKGLHVGHPLGYIGTDVLGRFMRMTGRNVLHTIGYDAFGLPAEQYAVRTGTHPRTTTEANIARYRAQLRRLGFAHDQRRSVATTDPEFFRWTQWIFTQLFEAWYDESAGDAPGRSARWSRSSTPATGPTPDGRAWAELTHAEQHQVLAGYRLAYIDEAPVNWCPGLGTVLSNEEVTADGRSAIGNFPVFRRNLRQWMMRITAYADRLLDDLDRLDWPESVKSMQRNWIGRSYGARLDFPVLPDARRTGRRRRSADAIEVYTTRPDTLFGATYMVLAPGAPAGRRDHRRRLAGRHRPALDRRRRHPGRGRRRLPAGGRPASPSWTGRRTRRRPASSPAPTPSTRPTAASLPVFIADYVLMGYGTGAIMAVPGQDTRDWDFATAFGLPIIRTVQPPADHPRRRGVHRRRAGDQQRQRRDLA